MYILCDIVIKVDNDIVNGIRVVIGFFLDVFFWSLGYGFFKMGKFFFYLIDGLGDEFFG